MKKRLFICLLALGSLSSVSVCANDSNNLLAQEPAQCETPACNPAPCDTVPCTPAPCNQVPCDVTPCNPGC